MGEVETWLERKKWSRYRYRMWNINKIKMIKQSGSARAAGSTHCNVWLEERERREIKEGIEVIVKGTWN